jgi:phosphopantothenoylcysteine synthetase/decarboxylase
MNVLVTAGNTQVPIDRVRCITNIFTGRTGARIALAAHARGHQVRLVTSHPETVAELNDGLAPKERWAVQPYRTFDDLQDAMATAISSGCYDVIVHCAAVSDYLAAGVYAPAPGTAFDVAKGRWDAPGAPELLDRAAGKVKSDEPELWLRLVRAPKLVDRIRTDWGFRGVLVKFKLEVGVNETALREIGERSRRQSDADFMVANTLEGAKTWALLGPLPDGYVRLTRAELPGRLLDAIEHRHEERCRG